MTDSDRARLATEAVISKPIPNGEVAVDLSDKLGCLVSAVGRDSEKAQQSAEYLYDLATHTRGLQDIYVEGLTMGQWYGMLERMATTLSPFVGKDKK